MPDQPDHTDVQRRTPAAARVDLRERPGRGRGREGFRDPNEVAGRELSIRLLREILECQQQLNALLEQPRPGSPNLINAYRQAIRVRREMLRDLPDQPRQRAPDRASA